jgi:cytochrome c5
MAALMAAKQSEAIGRIRRIDHPQRYQAQDLPEGAGKDLVTKVCTVCHEVTRITSKKKTKEEWSDTVDKMAARGAMATDAEFETIVTHLAKNFARD